MFPFTYGLACCAIEMLSSGFARFDVARYGMEVFRPTPRQCDLMIVAGTVNEKMAPVLKRLYEQMSEPKWVIAMGACATSGGPFYDGYNVVNGVDKVVPVDVYIPGCPPRPEALFQGLLELQKKIQTMRIVPPLPTAARPRRRAAAPAGTPAGTAAPAEKARASGAARDRCGRPVDRRRRRSSGRRLRSRPLRPPRPGARHGRGRGRSRPAARRRRASARDSTASPTSRATSSPRSTTAIASRRVYHLYSFASNTYLELHVDVPRAKPVVDTVSDVWPAADWHEREAWDMMGIRFDGHPDLRRILLKDDWVGHPLRKDYVDSVENHPHV